MAIRSVVTRGYGPGATIPLVVMRGYAVAAIAVVITGTLDGDSAIAGTLDGGPLTGAIDGDGAITGTVG